MYGKPSAANTFPLRPKLAKAHRPTSLGAGIMGFWGGRRMAMPHAGQLAGVEALLIVHQDQIRRVETIVAVDLDKEISSDVLGTPLSSEILWSTTTGRPMSGHGFEPHDGEQIAKR